MPFDDEADAVAKANDTEYGLSGSIFTNDLGRGLRVARAVDAGNLSVNSHSSVRYWTPFGGYKQSGLGRELGPDAPDGVHRGEERVRRALAPCCWDPRFTGDSSASRPLQRLRSAGTA